MLPFRTLLRGAATTLAWLAVATAAPVARPADDAAAPPQIYKWVDEHGITHYTTDAGRIPRAVRNRMRSLPDVAAPAPAAAETGLDLMGPRPDRPEHPEGWVSRNAAAWPTEDEEEALQAAELADQIDRYDKKIEGLEGKIADREERLLALLANAQGDTLRNDPAFRALADELPGLQADLEALRDRRGELATPP